MKILIAGFEQETNSYSPVLTKMDMLDGCMYIGQDEMRKEFLGKKAAISGIIDAINGYGSQHFDIVLALSMRAPNCGPVEMEVVDFFTDHVEKVIRENEDIGGVFLALHGATQLTEYDDGAGLILERVRRMVGDEVVITTSTDLHACITKKMMHNADAICGYNTYPHEDLYETGFRSATLGLQALTGNKPVCACVKIPMISQIENYSTLEGPFKELHDEAKVLRKNGTIRDFSIYQMQPWLDVEEGGSAVIVAADDKATAEKYAAELAGKLFDMRKQFSGDLYPIDEVIDIAIANKTGKPVILVDSADSPNSGANGDSSYVLEHLLKRKVGIKCALLVNDTPAAEKAFKTGIGNYADFELGGTLDKKLQRSIKVRAYVKSLHDGKYVVEGAPARGMTHDSGYTAVLRVGTIDIVVCRRMINTGDPQIFRAFGVEPSLYDLVAVKSGTQYKTEYSKFTKLFYPTDTPGSATAKLETIPTKRLPRPFYPFDEIDGYKPSIYAFSHNC